MLVYYLLRLASSLLVGLTSVSLEQGFMFSISRVQERDESKIFRPAKVPARQHP